MNKNTELLTKTNIEAWGSQTLDMQSYTEVAKNVTLQMVTPDGKGLRPFNPISDLAFPIFLGIFSALVLAEFVRRVTGGKP